MPTLAIASGVAGVATGAALSSAVYYYRSLATSTTRTDMNEASKHHHRKDTAPSTDDILTWAKSALKSPLGGTFIPGTDTDVLFATLEDVRKRHPGEFDEFVRDLYRVWRDFHDVSSETGLVLEPAVKACWALLELNGRLDVLMEQA